MKASTAASTMLPAYCDPPNPCPIGYTTADGCIEDFENSSEFSRRYQATQKCICDTEHMFDCPRQDVQRGPDAIEAVVWKLSLSDNVAKSIQISSKNSHFLSKFFGKKLKSNFDADSSDSKV